MTDLPESSGVREITLEWRDGEKLQDACRRVAVDALYANRDAGRMMDDAGRACADAVLALLEQEMGVSVDEAP